MRPFLHTQANRNKERPVSLILHFELGCNRSNHPLDRGMCEVYP